MTNLARRRFFKGRQNSTHQALPWAVSKTDFFDKCERCTLCISACETQIIKKGDGGFPTIDFSQGECSYCYQCASVCPQPIFNLKSTNPWQQTVSIDASCLTMQKVTCRSCEDACEPMAITFKAILASPAQPVINTDLCNGCGACIKPCPTQSLTISQGEH
ncbi:MAG: nitrate reductase [Osedax symbiont Rs1]|nr:MAG: nitrate reductase [Osedax symbiont Rs1]